MTDRTVALALCALLALTALTGCGGRGGATATPAGSPTATATPPSVDLTSEPTSQPGVKVGPPDAAGRRAYTDTNGRFSLSFPQAWQPSNPSTQSAYPSVTLRTEQPADRVSPVVIQFVDNPEHFSPQAILENKWRPAEGAQVSTATLGPVTMVEVRVQLTTKRGKPLYVYEVAREFTNTFAIAHVEGSDKEAVDAVAERTREVMASLQSR